MGMMRIERFFVLGLAQFFYLIASGNEAVVVYPERKVDGHVAYLEANAEKISGEILRVLRIVPSPPNKRVKRIRVEPAQSHRNPFCNLVKAGPAALAASLDRYTSRREPIAARESTAYDLSCDQKRTPWLWLCLLLLDPLAPPRARGRDQIAT